MRSIFLLTFILVSCQGDVSRCKQYVPHKLEFVETDPKILKLDNGTIVYSANYGSTYALYAYSNGLIRCLQAPGQRYPFIYKDFVRGLADPFGNETYFFEDEQMKVLTNHRPIEQLSMIGKDSLLLKFKNEQRIYLLNGRTGDNKVFLENVNEVHGFCNSVQSSFLFASCDDRLLSIDRKSGEIKEKASELKGEKRSLYCDGSSLYFTNNQYEFESVFKIDLKDSSGTPKLLFESDRDIKLFTIHKDKYYFVEVIRNEYLLCRTDFGGRNKEQLTAKGVVYNYEFAGDSIFVIYSDVRTPRTAWILDPGSRAKRILTDSVNNDYHIQVEFLQSAYGRSPAYHLTSATAPECSKVILYIHPGFHADFSPRWDPILSQLVRAGYQIYAPNYPMSFGNGKVYTNKSFDDAASDLEKWITYLKERHNEKITLLTSSSGTLLMEEILSRNTNKLNAAISLFGLAENTPEINIPVLYILGRNDEYVDFSSRWEELSNRRQNNKLIIADTIPSAGHWITDKNQLKELTGKIFQFLNTI